jgi:hypothetical protein
VNFILNGGRRIALIFLVCAFAGYFATNNISGQTNQESFTTALSTTGHPLDLHFQSKDRMFQGQIKILPTWKNTSLRFVNLKTGQDLGTYRNILENLTSAKPEFKIYNHKSDIFSDEDVAESEKNPAQAEQKVTFYKDDSDPTQLHFSSIFDAVGTIQVQVIQDGKQIAYGQTELTTDAEFSSLIDATDKAISGPSPSVQTNSAPTPSGK